MSKCENRDTRVKKLTLFGVKLIKATAALGVLNKVQLISQILNINTW